MWTGCAYHKVQPVSLPQVVVTKQRSLLQLFASQHQLLVTRADIQLGFDQLLQRASFSSDNPIDILQNLTFRVSTESP